MDPLNSNTSSHILQGTPTGPSSSLGQSGPAASKAEALRQKILASRQKFNTVTEEASQEVVTKKAASIDLSESKVDKASALEEMLRKQNAIEHVVVGTELVPAADGKPATVVATRAKEMSETDLKQSGNKKMVIHGDSLCVHPDFGLAHGQKVILIINGEQREFTVRHLTDSEMKSFSKMVDAYIVQLGQANNSAARKDESEDKGPLGPLQNRRSVAVIHNPHEHKKGGHDNKVDNTAKNERSEKLKELEIDERKGIQSARDAVHYTQLMERLKIRAFMFISRDFKDCFNKDISHLMAAHKEISRVSAEHLNQAREDP